MLKNHLLDINGAVRWFVKKEIETKNMYDIVEKPKPYVSE